MQVPLHAVLIIKIMSTVIKTAPTLKKGKLNFANDYQSRMQFSQQTLLIIKIHGIYDLSRNNYCALKKGKLKHADDYQFKMQFPRQTLLMP